MGLSNAFVGWRGKQTLGEPWRSSAWCGNPISSEVCESVNHLAVLILGKRLIRDNMGLDRQRGAAYMPEESSYRDFFGPRRRTLEAKIQEIGLQIQALQSERNEAQAELEKLIRAMQILEESPTSVEPRPKLTIKQGVLKVLEGAPNGLGALQIMARLKVDFDLVYDRTSLSPQLSRLKREGKIKLDGGIWSLKK